MSTISSFLNKTLLVIAITAISVVAYYKYDQQSNTWVDINDSKKKKRKNGISSAIPDIPETELPPTTPGLYICGATDKNTYLFPRRVELFDGMKLRGIQFDNDRKNSFGHQAIVIDSKGNLLRWSIESNMLTPVLERQNVTQIRLSNGKIYALNKKNKLLIIPNVLSTTSLEDNNQMQTYEFLDLSILNKSNEKIIQIDSGKDHLIVLTNKNKVYSASTNTNPNWNKSKNYFGQLGLPDFSENEDDKDFFKPDKLFEIELLNKTIKTDKKGNQKLITRKIQKISCGNNHTLVRDSNDDVFVFGCNLNGQLGLDSKYPFVPYPLKLEKNEVTSKSIDVNCIGDSSFITTTSDKTTDKNVKVENYFAFGNGQYGELGIGNYTSYQNILSPVNVLNKNANELNDPIQNWSVNGIDNVICTLHSGKVLVWGQNINGQLATGKKIKLSIPSTIPGLLMPGIKNNSKSVYKSELNLLPHQCIETSKDISCIFWKA
ncbi:hypothetical protein TBLA_0C00340 [Henningerozyma blattae CBS 6284]|uniref:Protein FMP25, mitochondrial n=1 Tax=Henningerozyma blattae (strain ATCC 34711 / CBS 6284 / DSM 70876 / NBRC 10599 / NRRL Y-10934 / UCD 77-7) TaxID=1071380 RepID=I2H0E8_HENB6|nr:hypothetical protein TBLA_0C00340 [Tetrapisispora blattae CBS 6284]CCH59850.1 hypothetical protein TBLA_0C00340 [Tetrapisispora blattae CBS 6284]